LGALSARADADRCACNARFPRERQYRSAVRLDVTVEAVVIGYDRSIGIKVPF
jgi:hypothetical protein